MTEAARRSLRSQSLFVGCCCAVVTLAIGCQRLPRVGESVTLARPQLSVDSTVLEVFTIRIPVGDAQLDQALWATIDEQRIDPEVRVRLLRNGLRAGVVSGPIPQELEQLLRLVDDQPTDSVDEQVVKLDAEPMVRKRRLQLRADRPAKIQTTPSQEELSVLFAGTEGVGGQTYYGAQPTLVLTCHPLEDAQVRLALTPELEHGEVKRQWDASDGIMFLNTGRPKRTFEELEVRADLVSGQLLVLSPLMDHPGSLGYQFLTDATTQQTEQKLVVVRVAQAHTPNLYQAAEEDDP